jgi:DNA-binding PadR family transcriptional regulator
MSLRIALLGLLAADGPSSGYELLKRFDGSLAHVWAARHSQIYPELAKMTAEGLATVSDAGPRGRKHYEITQIGRRRLDDWLIDSLPSHRIRSEANLRMFLLPLLDAPDAIRLLRREAAEYSTQIQELEAVRALHHEPSEVRRNGWYALDLGIRQMTAIRDWATATADHIESLI